MNYLKILINITPEKQESLYLDISALENLAQKVNFIEWLF